MFIRSQIYNVEYDELINKAWAWPERDMKHGSLLQSSQEFTRFAVSGFPTPVVRRDSMDE